MRTRKFPALIALLVAFAALGSAASAEDAAVSATVTETDANGIRTILSITPVVMTDIGTSGQVQGDLSVSVQEIAVLAPNGNDYFVDAQLSDLELITDTGVDLTTIDPLSPPNTDNTVTIAATNVSANNTSATSLDSAATISEHAGAGGAFGGANPVELFRVDGYSADLLYTQTVTGEADMVLTIPNAVEQGSYYGKLTVTLNQ